MAVRSFNGTLDQIRTSGTGTAIFNGAFSIVMLLKPFTLAAGEGYCGFKSGSGSTWEAALIEEGSAKLGFVTNTADTSAALTTVTQDVWNVVATTKPSGNTQGQVHSKQYGTGSWSHSGATGSTHTGVASSITDIYFGWDAFGTFKDCYIATAAVFTGVELTNLQVESVETSASTQNLKDLGATGLWDFNQASTGTAVSDLVGNFNQSAITGTTVVTGDDPPGWTFGLGAPPASNAPQLLRVVRSNKFST